MPPATQNSLCPCGSGKLYKQCCGVIISTRPVATPLPSAESLRTLLQNAMVHHQAGRLPQAQAIYQQILQLAPNAHTAWHGLGVVAHQLGQHRHAVELLSNAIKLEPQAASYHNNLGNALKGLGDFHAADESYRRALALAPGLASASNNLGITLQALGDINGAMEALERASAQAPDNAQILNNLANIYKEQGRLDKALDYYERAMGVNPNFREAHSNFLAALKLSHSHSPEQVYALHRAFGRKLESELLADYLPLENTVGRERKLTVGYVSPDCHTAVPAFIRPVLRAHDPQHFRVICYFNNPQPPENNYVIARNIEHRVMKGRSDQQVAEMIRHDGVDILVDIAGHTGINRLGVFARRAAPVQVTWLDYLNTTGLSSMDYRLTDHAADPPGASEHLHSETLWRLPDTQWCWEPPLSAPAVTALPALANGYITFGSFNNYSKLTDCTLALWARLLTSLPTARILLVGVAPGYCQERVRQALGVAGERIEFAPRVSADEYRALFGKVDMALDPLLFSGATTTLDALWQGAPVITQAGATSASRSSTSILSCLELNNWAANGDAGYLAIAEHWARNIPVLASLRASLRERLRTSPLTNSERFTRNLESAYREMWQRWCAARLTTSAHNTLPIRNPSARREADLLLLEADEQIRQGSLEQGAGLLCTVLRYQQNWRHAQKLLATTLLQWARAHPDVIAKQFPAPEPAPIDRRLVSVIICSINPEKFTRVSNNFRERMSNHPHEIIGVHDAKSLCEGYNRGARMAKGDILVFSHDDIEIVTPDFAPRLLAHMRRFDGVGICGTTLLAGSTWVEAGQPWVHGHIVHRKPGEPGYLLMVNGCDTAVVEQAQAWDGLFFAVQRTVWEKIGFDEQTFDGFHLYDVDFSFRAHLAGFNLALVMDLLLIHDSMGRYGTEWRRYDRRFREKFAGRLASPPDNIPGDMHCKLQSLDQVGLLRAALLYFHYGAAE